MKVKLIILLFCLAAGCQSHIKSIKNHVYFVPAGAEFQTVNYGMIKTESSGIWMSDFYFNEYFEAELENIQ